MSRHIHRLASPKIYPVLKKEAHYIIRANPGPHPKDNSLPLAVILRDLMRLTKSAKEAKKILNANSVLVDQKIRKDYKFPVGLMDVISIPSINSNYRFLFDEKGKVKLVKISENEAKIKLCKIKNKKAAKKGKIQITLHDGRNILIDEKKFNTGDTIEISLPNQEIKKHLPLEKDVYVYITDGTHIGETAKIIEFKSMPGSNQDRVALQTNDGKSFETLKKYIFVIGKDKPEIKLPGEESE